MKRYDGISIRSSASFREEARLALRRKWKPALLVFLVLLLMTGMIIGANCSYSTSTESAPYWDLEASIGPFTTLSVWKNGRLVADYASETSSFFVLPYHPLFVAAAALTALMFLILRPISVLAQTRMMVNLLDGITPDFSVLNTSGRQYWLYVRTELLILWQIFWPMMLLVLAGTVLSAVFPEADIVAALFILAGFVLLIIRMFGYVAAVYLIVTRPDMTARSALKTSKQLMNGRKWRYIILNLTFIGWEMLCCAFAAALALLFGETPLSFLAMLLAGLPFIPLALYMTVAHTAFLRDADARVNGQPPVTDLVASLIASGESPAQSEESPEENQLTPDDPWSDDGK